MYLFKSAQKFLQIQTSADGRKVISSQISDIEPIFSSATVIRIGIFDNQGSRHAWTWAWTIDPHSFEVWSPKGLCFKVNPTGDLIFIESRRYETKSLTSICIGKTGWVSYGIIGLSSDGSKVSILKDTYPFFDSVFNSTYDGLCEEEDFFPLQMIGKELSSRLKIPFDSTIHN